MTHTELNVLKKYYGTKTFKDAKTLLKILNFKGPEKQPETLAEWCEANPDRCCYFIGVKGTPLVQVTFKTGKVATYQVAHLDTTGVYEY